MQRTILSLITLSPTYASSSSKYLDLEKTLLDMPYYQPLYVNDIAPSDWFEQRKWLASLSLPFTIMLYKFANGNNLGTLVYAWRTLEDKPVDNTIVSRVFSELCRQQSFYSSHAMCCDFLSKYTRLANDSSSPEYSGQIEVDEQCCPACRRSRDCS